MSFTMYFDGCSKGNPGLAGAGAVLYDPSGKEIWADSFFVGTKETNNVAEYTGLLLGLREASKRGIQDILVRGDSLLVIKQMRGEYKVNSPNIQSLFLEARQLSLKFKTIVFEHVYREKNKRADELSNLGIQSNK
jgi:ribonuclease HI